MKHDQRRSRWMMRVREWDDRAHYPNVWHEGMPCQIYAVDRVAGRLRLGDLIAIYYPTSQRHPERSARFLGISRVTGLRGAHQSGLAWIDLTTAFRFEPPIDLKQQPSRVFLCCDHDWPGSEVELFDRLFDLAVEAGWRPRPEEQVSVDSGPPEPAPALEPDQTAQPSATALPSSTKQNEVQAELPAAAQPLPPPAPQSAPSPVTVERTAEPKGRMFGGVDYSGDMRDPRDGTWLATVELGQNDRLAVVRLEATGRSGLERYLRDPDTNLMHAEAIGLDFPFGLPAAFAESLLGGPFPEEGWWALAKRLERLSRPEYLTRLQEFRAEHGEVLRLTDEQAEAYSPLRRVNPDRGSRAFHGIRMIAEDRSRFAMRPFESAQGKLLLEVHPASFVRRIATGESGPREREPLRQILEGLRALDHLPIDVGGAFLASCLSRRAALDAVIAARLAAGAVLDGEADKGPDELAPGDGDRVRREGWIYGLQQPA